MYLFIDVMTVNIHTRCKCSEPNPSGEKWVSEAENTQTWWSAAESNQITAVGFIRSVSLIKNFTWTLSRKWETLWIVSEPHVLMNNMWRHCQEPEPERITLIYSTWLDDTNWFWPLIGWGVFRDGGWRHPVGGERSRRLHLLLRTR